MEGGRHGKAGGGPGRTVALAVVALTLLSMVPAELALAAEPVPEIDLRDPDGGETFVQGQLAEVTWRTTGGSTGYIHVFLSTDGGASWDHQKYIRVGPLVVTGTEWRVPFGVESDLCRIRVAWSSSSNPKGIAYSTDESAGDFTIERGTYMRFVNVTSEMSYGKYYPVSWELFDPAGDVAALDLEVRVDEGGGWGAWTSMGARYQDIPPWMSFIHFTPPNYRMATGMLRLRSEDASGAIIGEVYSAEFDIISPLVVLLAPNGGVTMVGGETYTIEWRVVDDPGETITGAALYYSQDSGSTWTVIISSTEDDGTYDWTVPSGLTDHDVRVRVDIYYLEFSVLGSDESDGDNQIVPDRSVLTLTLLDPNPPATGNFMEGGASYTVRWSHTGSDSAITRFDLAYSLDSGATWNGIGTARSTDSDHSWAPPRVDTDRARFRVSLVRSGLDPIEAVSNNDFIIYTCATFNIPPIAEAGPAQTVDELTRVDLDGTGTVDPNRDPLLYCWTVVSGGGFGLVINDPGTPTPWFVPNIADYQYTFVIQLEVDDGGPRDPDWPFYTDRVSITVRPGPPQITGFSPRVGWAGSNVTVTADNAAGAQLYIGSTPAVTIPSSYVDGTDFEFTIGEHVPLGEHNLTLESLAGNHTTTDTIVIFHRPQWTFDNGLSWHNPSDHFLSYPWDITAARGNYRTTFGDVIYIPYWVCIGVPWWDPWNGLVCLGYEISAPTGIPDPLAALYYGAMYCWVGRLGQCFGMSATALQFLYGDLDLADYNATATRVNELQQTDGTIDHWVESMQGSQLSVEVLDHYLWAFAAGLVASGEGPPATGLPWVIEQVEDSIASGELGVLTMVDGASGHAVVPYHVERDGSRTRIYVYDCNREYFSFDDPHIGSSYGDTDNYPPHILIERAGSLWTWHYEMAGGTDWSSTVGLVFCPYDVVNGPRTLPTDWEGMISFLAGDAASALEDGSGGRMAWRDDGSLEHGIDGAAPLPNFQGLGDSLYGWYTDHVADYSTTITGTRPGGGVYNWTYLCDGTSAFALEMVGLDKDEVDGLDVDYPDGNPLRGRLTYSTTGASKDYSCTQVKRMGEGDDRPRTRVYKVSGATLHPDSLHVINTTDDYDSLVFENRGPHAVTIAVSFETNVMSEGVLNASGGVPPSSLPSASRNGITVGPYETVIVTPSDWLDLDGAEVEVTTITPELQPPGRPATFRGRGYLGQVVLEWTAPEDDGGAAVTGYMLYRGEAYDAMNQYMELGAVTAFVDSSVDTGKTYFYALAAINAAGIGAMSPALGVFVFQDAVAPGMVGGLNATAEPGMVTLTWTAPVDTGGAAVTGYVVYRSEDEWATSPPKLAQVGDVLEYEDKQVVANTTYYYYVAAINSAGEGPQAGQVSATVPVDGGGGGGNGGGGNGDGDGGGDDSGGFAAWEYLAATVMLVAAVSVGALVGTRLKRR